MRTNIGRRRLAIAFAASVCWLAPSPGRGDTVDASSTTMLILRDQARAGTTRRIAPLYELLTVSARDISNPVAENLQLVFSGWGAVALGENLVWFDRNRPTNHVFADLDLAYLQGELIQRTVQLRFGRQLLAGGLTGGLLLDGGNVLVRLPRGFGVSGYIGVPVSQRFDKRGTEATFNPTRGDFATGARAYWTLPAWGEVGASVMDVEDDGDPSLRQVGADLRLTLPFPLAVFADTSYDFYEERWAAARLLGQYQLTRMLLVSGDYRYVEPDLLLPRNSIFAVFALDRRNEVGAAARYGPWKELTFDGDYHFLDLEDGTGHRAGARGTWLAVRDTILGLELTALVTPQNDYLGARAFGSRRLGRLTGTLDVQEYVFDRSVNGPGSGRKNSFIASATLGYSLGLGFDALVFGSAGATPFYESRFDLMAKLVYNQSYRVREVR